MNIYISEAPFARFVFANSRMAWFWLIIRLYVGWQWIVAGWEKLHSDLWVGSKAGTALAGFLNAALAKTSGEHPDVQGWYAAFLHGVVLPNAATWSHIVAWGEFLVGAALILGLFTGIAAFLGLFMNLNYLLAGTVSTNPVLFTLAIGLILAWRIAGYHGLDRRALPFLGTPWKPGDIFRRDF